MKKIKINIPGFGERFCSNNVEYKLFDNRDMYKFCKKGTNIKHNEYGPVWENKDGSYIYRINNEFHRLNDCALDNSYTKCKSYFVIGKYLGDTKEKFIKNLANTLIPINKVFYEN